MTVEQAPAASRLNFQRLIYQGVSLSSRPWVLWQERSRKGAVTLEWSNRSPLVLVLVLLVFQLLFPSRAWMTLLLGVIVMTLAGGLWAWQLAKGLRASRELRFALIQVGDLLEERFCLTNDAVVPALWVQVIDHGGIPGYDANTVRTVGARSEYRWVTQGECRLRGEYRLGPWETLTWDPFHIFAVREWHPEVETVLIYPSIAHQLPFGLPRGRSAGWAHISQRSWEPTLNVGGVRAYVPGDPRRHVHWPTTARRDQLFVKEFDQDTGGDIWIILDLDQGVHVGSGETSTEELGVTVAGSVAALLLDARRAVGLIAFGSTARMVMPARGREHLWRILRALASMRTGPANPLSHVLEAAARVVPTGATALVITPALDGEWLSGLARLQGQSVGAAVIIVDRDSFTAERQPLASTDRRSSSRAEVLRGLLANMGVEAEIIRADTPLVLRPPTGQVRRWEFKVLGTGRAIAISTPWGQ